jgi:hypothetical protein
MDVKNIRQEVLRVFDGVAYDLGVSDPSDDEFIEYISNKLSDFGAPDEVIETIIDSL